MSEATQYTAEPWHECANGDCQCGQILGSNSEHICTVKNPAARRRILACVNACAQVRTETLERVPLHLSTKEMVERIESAEVQRDQLQSAFHARGLSIDNLLNIQGKQSTEIERLTQQRDQLLEALQELIDIRCPLTGYPSHAELVEHWEDEKAEGNGEASVNLQALAAIAAAKGGAA